MTRPFREFSEFEIAAMDDEQLLAYILRARAAAAQAASDHGVRHLVFRHMDTVRAMVRKRIPTHLVDEVTHDAMVSAIKSTFDGEHELQFHKWLAVITRRQIADFYRGKAGKLLELDREGAGKFDDQGNVRVERASLDDTTLELDELIEQVLATRSAIHREVIDLYVFGGFSAKEVSVETGESPDNVFQIAKRFRDELRAALEAADRPPSPDSDPETS